MSDLLTRIGEALEIDRLATPGALWLLLALPLVLWADMRRGRWSPLRFSSSIPLSPLGPTLRQRALVLLPALRALALTLLILALARPQEGFGETRVSAEGVAIVAVVDRSWSMNDTMAFEGRPARRIDVVKRVFREFVEGNDDGLEGRPHDLIGLVTFARFADTVCPPVRDHGILADLVELVQLANPRDRRVAGTAIGEGLALGAARLDRIEERYEEVRDATASDDEASGDAPQAEEEEEGEEERAARAEPEFIIKSKIIVLLTDGDENMGEISAREAAGLCRELGIKIYAIGIGDRRGRFGFRPDVLRGLAKATGGLFRVARDAESLRGIYAEIDELETTEIRSIEHTSYAERWAAWGAGGLAALALHALLGATWLRRAP